MSRVLFIGEINVDVMMGGMESPPIVDREVPCKTYDVVMGALTVVCACAYASLGGDTSFAGLAGEDDYGDFMVRGLRGFGIDTDLVRRTSQVRTGVTVNMIHGSARTQATYPGTIAEYDGAGLGEAVFKRFDHVHFAGVYLETKLLPRIAGLLKIAREAGITSSLDPQWDSTERWEHMDEWLPLVTYLFVNQDEAMSITGATSAQEACRRLVPRTACPLVKVGEDGALVPVDGRVVSVPSRAVEVVDTTGAGDSFDAGFLFARFCKKMGLVEAAEFANALAARSCTFVGGVNARSSYEDVLRFMDHSAIR